MSAAYKQAIDLLVNGQFDSKALAVSLAKEYPEIFVALANSIQVPIQWHREVAQMLTGKNPNRVNAIKHIREHTGFFLKDAKDIADVLTGKFILAGKTETTFNPDHFARYEDLPVAHAQLVDAIFASVR